jgi:hypothetical protein
MGMWDAVRREQVLTAVQEYDALGQAAFLARHGFGPARAYQLIVNGRSYDSKAVLGAAYRIATGQRISPHDFNGGVGSNGAASVLRRLGFEVRKTQDTSIRRAPRVSPPATAIDLKPRNGQTAVTGADVVLIGCVKTKLPGAAPAREMYTSPLFRKRRTFAEASAKPWFILSAFHGLVRPDTVLEHYDMYLAGQPRAYRSEWGRRVVRDLENEIGPLSGLTIEIHAGSTYVEPLEPLLTAAGANVSVPLAGLSQGEHLAWYAAPPVGHPSGAEGPTQRSDSPEDGVESAINALIGTPAPAADFPWGRTDLARPGLYAWWVDRKGASSVQVSPTGDLTLLYTGQAGATAWPSGKRSGATLLSRIRGQHLGGVIYSSTLRRTFAALLLTELELRVTGPKTLDAASEARLTQWLRSHLWLTVWPCSNPDALRAVEHHVITKLDAPLNLMGAGNTPLRERLRSARGDLRLAASDRSDDPCRQRGDQAENGTE